MDSQERREQGAHKAIQGWGGKFSFPHLELSPPGPGLLSTAPSASLQLASLQCVQTMQYLLGWREVGSTAHWLQPWVEMDGGKSVPLGSS